MPPRSRPPYPMQNPRMANGMMPRGGNPFMYGRGPGMGSQTGMRSGMRGPMSMGQGGPGAQGQRGGGLLSKLLGKAGGGTQGATSGPLSSFSSRAAQGATQGGGGILKALTDPTALNGFLTNTQKVLNSAQQIGPMVQQYGPLVRNIPSIWKLYKGLKDVPEEPEESTKTEAKVEQDDSKPIKKQKKRPDISPEAEEPNETSSQKGQSIPKLYI